MLLANHVFCSSLQISQKSKVITDIYVIIIVHNIPLLASPQTPIKCHNSLINHMSNILVGDSTVLPLLVVVDSETNSCAVSKLAIVHIGCSIGQILVLGSGAYFLVLLTIVSKSFSDWVGELRLSVCPSVLICDVLIGFLCRKLSL